MLNPSVPILATWLIALLSIALMLARPRGIAEVYWAGGGAVALLLCGLIPWRQAGHAVGEGLDVYLFLTGMMVLAELAREEGVFDWVADVAAQHSHGSPARLFLLIYLAGTIVTAFLSNDATAVVMTPAVLAAVRRAGVTPEPHLLACALIANAASFVFPISNPANLVVFGAQMPALRAWLGVFLLPSIAAIVLTYVCLRFMSRAALRGTMSREMKRVVLSTEGKLALGGLLIAAAALIGASALGLRLGLPTCVAAVFATLVVSWTDRRVSLRVVKGVAWSVLPLVAGLFVIMQALQNAGMLRLGISGLRWLQTSSPRVASFFAAGGVALLSNVMNNLPVGLMSGAAIRGAQETGQVAHAILVGVDLGPNLSVTGSLATILWLMALRRERVNISAWEFFKVGMISMPIAMLGSLLLLRN